ncbi:Uncharacterized protein FWK35_00024423 [Aphis craccivora]|uniref:Uncharacterized protein n=1 Tax=Aphis craccivora TaxID=307492 RepID=A0A6G0ZEX8_APHCR|nr:Uncharacterized protein FWK35_00024423 [Aphis craccivora]
MRDLVLLDFKRSNECIDFTMLCVCFVFFFVSVYTRACRNNASTFNFSCFSGSKVNLVGALGWSFFEFPNTPGKTKKKLRKNGNFYAKPNRFFLYGCNSKTNHCKYLKFSPNTTEILNFSEKNSYGSIKILENLIQKLKTQYEIFQKFSKFFNFLNASLHLVFKLMTNNNYTIYSINAKQLSKSNCS